MAFVKFISGASLPKSLFCLGLLLTLFCVLLPKAFLTHDGPSHLYNSFVVDQLLFEENTVYHQHHAINPHWWLQPNLIGYLLLCFFQLFVPFLWAEKITIALYVLGFALGFRYFLRRLTPEADWMSLLVLPFLFNTVLFWGFYNFLIGLALNFWLLGYYEKRRADLGKRSLVVLTLLSLGIFYSHAMVFVVSGSYIGIRELLAWTRDRKGVWMSIRRLLFLLPGTLLLLLYLQQPKPVSVRGVGGTASVAERLSQLFPNIESLSFAGYSEGTPVLVIYFVLLLLAALKVIEDIKTGQSGLSAPFLTTLLYLLALLFTPDAIAGGSIIILRLNLLFFLFLLVWVSRQTLTKMAKGLLLVGFLAGMLLLALRWDLIRAGSRQVEHVLVNSQGIGENSLLGAVHYKPVGSFVGPYQIHCYFDIVTNIDHYAAIENKALALHNYEADRESFGSYFPVVWKENTVGLIVWKEETDGKVMEYIDLGVSERMFGAMPLTILSIGSPDEEEIGKAEWDRRDRYSLFLADSVVFLKIYRLTE